MNITVSQTNIYYDVALTNVKCNTCDYRLCTAKCMHHLYVNVISYKVVENKVKMRKLNVINYMHRYDTTIVSQAYIPMFSLHCMSYF